MKVRKGSVAVVGAAESDLGVCAPGTSPLDLMAQASFRALADAGLTLSQVDGLFCASTQTRFTTLALAEYLNIKPRYQDNTQMGGASFMSHVTHAMAALEQGLCEVALIAYGSTQRSVSRAAASPREVNPYETPYRPLLPVTAYAMAAARHMHQYGTTRAQLADVAVAARQWALLNPKAWEKQPLTQAEVIAARKVSDPLTVRDCCLVSDGGGALVLTRADRARHLRQPPVYVLGVGESLSHASISNMPDLTVTGAVASSQAAFAMAGYGAQDMNLAMLYDAFTITPILFLEDLGFCAKGEGGAFVSDGGIAPGGHLAVNTNGGGLSYCHPGMYGLLLLVEAVRQLRGACGARQVAECDLAVAHGNGGVLSSQATVVLGREPT
jgi:acetyl-CoA acetyltransferase